jgi:hypothetical protein
MIEWRAHTRKSSCGGLELLARAQHTLTRPAAAASHPPRPTAVLVHRSDGPPHHRVLAGRVGPAPRQPKAAAPSRCASPLAAGTGPGGQRGRSGAPRRPARRMQQQCNARTRTHAAGTVKQRLVPTTNGAKWLARVRCGQHHRLVPCKVKAWPGFPASPGAGKRRAQRTPVHPARREAVPALPRPLDAVVPPPRRRPALLRLAPPGPLTLQVAEALFHQQAKLGQKRRAWSRNPCTSQSSTPPATGRCRGVAQRRCWAPAVGRARFAQPQGAWVGCRAGARRAARGRPTDGEEGVP